LVVEVSPALTPSIIFGREFPQHLAGRAHGVPQTAVFGFELRDPLAQDGILGLSRFQGGNHVVQNAPYFATRLDRRGIPGIGTTRRAGSLINAYEPEYLASIIFFCLDEGAIHAPRVLGWLKCPGNTRAMPRPPRNFWNTDKPKAIEGQRSATAALSRRPSPHDVYDVERSMPS
jgi:hypothetical protein